MSCPRSGSTILSTILGGHPSVFSAGELNNIIEAMDVRREYCSCGVRSEHCAFWIRVRQEWEGASAKSIAGEYANLVKRFEQPRRLDWIRISSRRWINDYQRGAWNRYISLTASLFEAIQRVSGADIIVDSSKSQSRAISLSKVQGLDFRVIHLVRDVRGVVFSLNRAWERDPEGGIAEPLVAARPSVVARRWAQTNFASNQVRRKLSEYGMLARYEDLVGSPDGTLRRIGAFTGLDFSKIATTIQLGKTFHPGHQIAGNRLRMQRDITVIPDARWRRELPRREKLLIWILAGGVPALYGYRP